MVPSKTVAPAHRKTVNCSFICVPVGVILICCGVLVLLMWPIISRQILTEVLKLTPGSETYEGWVETRIPNYMDVYVFNWLNPEDITDHTKKLRFAEMGPYRFLEKVKKTDIVFNDHNDTVTYKLAHHWFFDEENSNGSLSDIFTTVNQVMLSAAYIEREASTFNLVKLALNGHFLIHPLAITLNVSQILFEGHDEDLLSMHRLMKGGTYAKYGLFYQKNGSSEIDGVYNVGTGAKDFRDAAVVKTWNYVHETNFYPGSCSDVSGTTGERFPIDNRKDEPIVIFSNSMCRSIDLLYESDVLVEDIPAFLYRSRAEWFDNGTVDPRNECYCGGKCLASGVLNTSVCHQNAPVFVSYPHFYMGDPVLLEKIEGLKPDPSKHDFFFAVEPQTGIPVDVVARVQINMLMQPYEKYSKFSELPQVVFPLLWLEQKARITPELAESFRLLLKMLRLDKVIAVLFFVIGSGMLATVALWHLRERRIRRRTKTANLISLTPRRST